MEQGHTDFLLPCFFKQTFGFDCPGCGLQRSIIALFNGDIMGSLHLYPATLPLILMMLFLAFHLKFKWNKGASILVWMFVLNVIIIHVNYLLKFNWF